MKNILFLLSFTIVVLSCQTDAAKTKEAPVNVELATIQKHIVELGSDKYMGRMPFTEGEELTVDYLVDQLKGLNIAPGNGDSYIQDVPLVEITGEMSPNMRVNTKNGSMDFDEMDDFVVHTQRMTDEVGLKESELVFCGYGITSDKDGWNDFEGVDMTGKTAVVLVNDPGFGSEDSTFFKGDIMTYFGRWTYKYEEADRQGADGLLIIHETASAGYPWFVVKSSWTGAQLGIERKDQMNDCGVKGWITLDVANTIFDQSGHSLRDLIQAARKPGFKPVSLGSTVSLGLENTYKKDVSKNVVGLIKGKKRPDEYVIYTAHWDHIGVGTAVEGDSIYNGALDNASGTGTILAVAEAYSKMPEAPDRSVVFLFVTAEEQGLLGSEYYCQNPIYPINQTVANLNKDGANIIGLSKDLTITGMGQSEMDDWAKKYADKQDRYTLPDQHPEKGYFFRSDHFNFAKVGIPALYAQGGYDHREKGIAYAAEKAQEYTSTNYHQPSDEYDESWDLTGAQQDAQLYFELGLDLANSKDWPKWKDGADFGRRKSKEVK